MSRNRNQKRWDQQRSTIRGADGKFVSKQDEKEEDETPSYNRQWYFTTSLAATPTISVLAPRSAPIPRVFYTPEVWERMWFIVDYCQEEVGWLGLVDEVEGGYLVTDIFVPEQEVSGAETDIGYEALTQLALDLINDGVDTSKLIYWGHSHVNMAVSPSNQDELQIDEFLNSCPLFIRGIYNKKRDSKVDVFDTRLGYVVQNVENRINTPLMSREEKRTWATLLTRNVVKRTYAAAHSLVGFPAGGTHLLDQDDDDDIDTKRPGKRNPLTIRGNR